MDLCASRDSLIVRIYHGFLGCFLLLLSDFFFHNIRIVIHKHFVATLDVLYQEGCSISNVRLVVQTRPGVSERLYISFIALNDNYLQLNPLEK